MCLDTVQNYVNCMTEHTVKDKVVTAGRVKEAEQILDNNSRSWTKMCRLGEWNNHMWRVNRALISNFTTIPPLLGLRKDHKRDINDNLSLGSKLRPLCPANPAPNKASNIFELPEAYTTRMHQKLSRNPLKMTSLVPD